MKKYNKYTVSRCECPVCGSSMFVPRITGRQREKNHKKDLYCWKCNKVVTMYEIREFDFSY